ncbi:hypothetical protein [Streptomyces sp. NPDC054940]
MTTKNTPISGDPGPEPRGRGRQLATTTAAPQETTGGWTKDQIDGLVTALDRLPRRLARQVLGDDERAYTPQFDAFYAAMHGAADAISKRTVTFNHPVTSAYWSSEHEDKAIVDTRLIPQTPAALNSVTSIDLQVGGQSYTWDPSKPHPVYPRLIGSHLQMEAPVPPGAGPFPIRGTVTYKDRDGGEHRYNVFPSDADVPRRRLTLLP